MKIHVLTTAADNKSYFSVETMATPDEQPLGKYSKPFTSEGVQFRQFEAGPLYPMHNAPREQYIVYLEGAVQVRASGGETKTFSTGDILLAKDVTGEGHESLTVSAGRALIVPVDL
jgi:quercetin dioxygenase-like cupin family protein